ncbi:MAG: hypothetical protein K0S45_2781 [Nitrospira sp.]|jgi:hypothetical protein|nr:hypothetical protein [Nitrospira sp.]
MKRYIAPLMRSGAMWSCGRPAQLSRGSKLWPSVLRWLGLSRQRPSALLALRRLVKPEKPWY